MHHLRSLYLVYLILVALAVACSRPVEERSPAASPALVSERLLNGDGWDYLQWSSGGQYIAFSGRNRETWLAEVGLP